MSLWEKWEREKLEKMGIKVERKSDVKILDTRSKPDIRKQSLIVVLAALACFILVFVGWTLHERFGGHWSDFPIIRHLAGTIEQRIDEGRSFR